MFQEMIRAFLLIFVAEMGDKTQILAMAFATRFPVRKVLLGIGIGALLNHGLAVVLGTYLSTVVPINTIQIIIGAAFIGFALWTLRLEKEGEEKKTGMRFGPTATVALAFFLGELGDKTQLTAITLAADARYPLMILAGTVSGMIATGALGIIIGKKLGDKIPEIGIKLVAATIFMFFGLQKLYQVLPVQYLQAHIVVPFISVLILIAACMIYLLIRQRQEGIQSAFIAKAKLLHDYYLHMKEDLNHICLGLEHCGACQGINCAIGHTKEIVEAALDNQEWQEASQVTSRGTSQKTLRATSQVTSRQASQETGIKYRKKSLLREKVLDCLVDTLLLISTVGDEKSLINAHCIRKQFESILLGKVIEKFDDLTSYIEEVKKVNAKLGNKIDRMLRMRKAREDKKEDRKERK